MGVFCMNSKIIECEMAILRAVVAKASQQDMPFSRRIGSKLDKIYGEICTISELDPQGVINSIYGGDLTPTTQSIGNVVHDISVAYDYLGASFSLE